MSKRVQSILDHPELFEAFGNAFSSVSDDEFELLLEAYSVCIPSKDRNCFKEEARILRHLTRPGRALH